MTIRKIAQIGHPILRGVSREVSRAELTSPELQRFIDDLVETMRDASGAGLAAPQVYEPIRICAIEVEKNERYPYKPRIPLTLLVNPRLSPLSDEEFTNDEGCLSVPNLRGKVQRKAEIRVEAWDRHGAPLDFVARGISAGTFQHEVDHLDGKLFLDRVVDPNSLSTWDNFQRYHRADFVSYVEGVVRRWGS